MLQLFMDSDEELWYDKAEEFGYKIISMPYVVEGELKDYFCGKNYDYKEFFDKIRHGVMPTTCALNAQDYINYFEPEFEKGNDIFYVHCSSKMTASFNYMEMALKELKEKYPERKFYSLDSLSISIGSALVVYLIGKKYKEGASIDELLKYGEEIKSKCTCVFTVNDLNHLKRGGRLSSISAFMGTLLDVKPIIKITEEGKLEKFMQVKGRKKAILTILDYYKNNCNFDVFSPMFLIHADCEGDAEYLKSKILEVNPKQEIFIQPVGPTVGAHCGPDTIGISFFKK